MPFRRLWCRKLTQFLATLVLVVLAYSTAAVGIARRRARRLPFRPVDER